MLYKSALIALFALALLAPLRAEEGRAVYYSNYFQGKTTASKEVFDQEGMTAAHKTLPFGTQVKLTNLANNKSVVVKINDRMPPNNGNLIDLTLKAARELDMVRAGSARVNLEVVK
jgi:rare lipoprotein A